MEDDLRSQEASLIPNVNSKGFIDCSSQDSCLRISLSTWPVTVTVTIVLIELLGNVQEDGAESLSL